MIMTNLGSEYWPQTLERRVLCAILTLYAFGVFGYVTAKLATLFVGRDAEESEGKIAGVREIAAVREELRGLREDIQAMAGRPTEGEPLLE